MRRHSLSCFAMAGAILACSPANAGNIVLTGHDNDHHFGGAASAAGVALAAEVKFVANGSSLPVLTFDRGSQLTSSLTALGIKFVNVDPSVAANITDDLFDVAKYSAFAVASEHCGTHAGDCGDNLPSDIANIAAHKAAISRFFNAGGGIFGLSGAMGSSAGDVYVQDPSAYAYVPETATNGGGNPPPSGYIQTPGGAALSLPPVNGNRTHNYFPAPGTEGLSALFVATELNGTNVETVALAHAKITGGETAQNLKLELDTTGVAVLHINFDLDRATFRPDAMPVIDQVAAMLKDNPPLRIEIDGHTDNLGSAAHNRVLSAQRAIAVELALEARGINRKRLSDGAFGSSKPVADNATEDGRFQNRRVELVKKPITP